MIYSKYSSTDIEVSAIGFGGMRIGDKDDINASACLLKTAYDKGINYFDTAPGYGKSEEIFGVAIKEMLKTRTRKPFYVSTKTFKSEPALVRKDIETSLKKLNLDYIDFYHLWCILSLDAYRERKAGGALKEMERLKNEGLIKHICISTHATGPDVEKILADYPFDGVLLGYSAMNFPYRDEGIDAAVKLNRAVVVMNPLGGGIIPQNSDRFSFVKTRSDETIVEAALRFLLNDCRITTTLVGFSEPEHIDQAISAVEGFEPIAPTTIEKIRNNLKTAFNQLCTSCRYCDKCEHGINVPRLMEAYNHYVLTNDPAKMLYRLSFHWDIKAEDTPLEDCTLCGQCESTCTQNLPICQRLEFIKVELEKSIKVKADKKKNESS
ncbi:MAG: aldo/keto reductase [Planctomycetota bacterium]|jgi:predicted aldo/keto reductase-like oxidoreductase